MELEVLWIMVTVLAGAILAASGIVYFYQKKVVTRNPNILKSMAIGGGLLILSGSVMIIFAFRTLMFLTGFVMIVAGILLIIGAVWSVIYTMKQMIETIKKVASK